MQSLHLSISKKCHSLPAKVGAVCSMLEGAHLWHAREAIVQLEIESSARYAQHAQLEPSWWTECETA